MTASLDAFRGLDPSESLEDLVSECRGAGLADWRIDAQALLLLHRSLTSNDVEAESRRLVRMADSEALVDREAVAAVCLARARRLQGRPWLANRILRAAMLPPGLTHFGNTEGTFSGLPGSALEAALGAGEPERVREWTARYGKTLWRTDAAVVAAIYEPTDGSQPEVESWRYGESPAMPRGFRDPTTIEHLYYVLLRPGLCGHRIAPGSLFNENLGVDPEEVIVLSHRLNEALHPLLFAGEAGLPYLDWIAAVFGDAELEAERRGLVRVMRHRIREALPPGVAFESTKDDRAFVRTKAPVLFQDPYGTIDLEERILTFLAWRPNETTADIARSIRLPLRRVQEALTAMVEDGLCEVHRDRRQFHYRIGDTTFHTRTSHRVEIEWE